MALKIKVGLIGLLDMLKFKNMGKDREATIDAASNADIKASFPINQNAKRLHPDYQDLVIDRIKDYPEAGAKKFVFKRQGGGNPANFRAGQYLSLKLEIDGSAVTRPYSICSTPHDATRNGKVAVTVKTNPGGFAADWMLNNFKKGDRVIASGPQGQFYYEPLRDAKNVVALAGGSGITPFLSMAGAIAEGAEDFNLTILFGSRTLDSILFKTELDKVAKASNGKVKVVHILSDEEVEGYEHGFISADIIKKYAPKDEDYSVFICGPEAMYKFLEKEITKLKLPRRFVRRELLGVTKDVANMKGYKGNPDATYKLKVHQGTKDYDLEAMANETLLVAIERAGIKAPSRCRSGECGWCRSQLESGKVFIPEDTDGRRFCDTEDNVIHPCATFPLSDCELTVPGEYWN
ncbi:MAG: flavin reductase family protein [Coriobacteriia bacterium]|nr:flavin reductase family protein [Coriobacteriia bacterium]